jgi:hypothetical protein
MPYTSEDRDKLRAELVAAGRGDPRIIGAAFTGSAATGLEDRWSDIDLMFGLANASDLPSVLADWTARIYGSYGAVHHVDVPFGGAVYRVFLLHSSLQVDLAFAPAAEFGARAPSFRLLFGVAADLPHVSTPAAEYLIGFGWLHAVHARSCIARGKLWQGEYMVSGVRDHVLSLACLRHGLPALQGRGMDRLPEQVTGPLQAALVKRLDADELRRAFRVAVQALVAEARCVNETLATRLHEVLTELASV